MSNANFWEKCAEYERMLADLNRDLNYKGPTEADVWNNAVTIMGHNYRVNRFWDGHPDQQRAYLNYVASRSPLPEHFAYLWES